MRKAILSREKIVRAAILMADEKGLSAVTLRALARRMKVHVTSLYNHVATKEALLAAMNRELMAEADLPMGSLAWEDWVRRFAIAVRSLSRRHPGAFQLLQQGPAQGVEAMQSVEAAIAAFQADGFDEVSTHCAIRTVNVAVLGLALDDLNRHLQPVIQAELHRLSKTEFPHIHRILSVADKSDPFEFLINAVIDGIAANRNRGKLRSDQGDSAQDRYSGR